MANLNIMLHECGAVMQDLRYVLAVLDADTYPQTVKYLQEALAEAEDTENDDPPSLFAFIRCLRDLDESRRMHPAVEDLTVNAYGVLIADGDVESMTELGSLYYCGEGVTQDYVRAMKYYTMAADRGDPNAMESLGYCWYYGRGGVVDYARAFACFLKGALTGRLVSLYKLADMYRRGYFVEKDERQAFQMYELCLRSMNEHTERYVAGPVFLRLGDAFCQGIGTEVDPNHALVCYRKAEEALLNMVENGDSMYYPSLLAAVEGQRRLTDERLRAASEGKPFPPLHPVTPED